MKLKYQTLSKEEQTKIKDKFLEDESSVVYKKSHKVLTIAVIGIIMSLISTAFDIVYKTGTINYIMDGFLFVFSLIFIFVMNNIKLKEINKYVVNKKKVK